MEVVRPKNGIETVITSAAFTALTTAFQAAPWILEECVGTSLRPTETACVKRNPHHCCAGSHAKPELSLSDLLSSVKMELAFISTAKLQMFGEMEGDVATCAVPVTNLPGIVPGLPDRTRQPLGNISYLKQTYRVRGRPV